MCYVLLVIQLLRMNGFFPLCYGFCPAVCHGLHRAVVSNSSDNLPSYLQTNIIAQMLSIGGEGQQD